jgi:RNA polymerase sigma-70 factor (ECF subfamily)
VPDPIATTRPARSEEDPVERLVARIQSGIDAESSFEQLYKHFRPRLIGYLAHRGLPPGVCEELTQEAFLRVFNEIGTLQHREAFTPWLFMIVKNLYNNELRRRKTIKRGAREVPLEEEQGPEDEDRRDTAPALVDGAPSAEEEMARRERSTQLRDAVATLPPQMRRCVLLRVYQDRKYREIAEILGISLDAVKAHLGQAKTRLQRLLGDHAPSLARLTAGDPGSEDET